MPRIVFVADDLGVSPGVNEGILRAARAGIVREASLCVTGSAVVDGLQQARAAGLGLGLHLSLTLGRALTGRVRGLTDGDARFRSLPRTLLATALRSVDRTALRAEVEAQLQRLRELGVVATHVNGHHHVHVFPMVRDVVFEAAAAAGIRWTRMPAELAVAGGRASPARLLLVAMSRRAAVAAGRCGLRWLPFVGMTTEGRSDFAGRAARLARRLPEGPCEWMVHPRLPDEALRAIDPVACAMPSASELAFLSDVEVVRGLKVVPTRYGDLDGG